MPLTTAAPYALWALAAMAVVVLGGVAVLGIYGVRAFGPLALAALIVVEPPWSWLVFAALVLAPVPIGALSESPVVANWGIAGAALGLAVFVLLQLLVAGQRLNEARGQLAAEAVARERQRIDDELHRTVVKDLTTIVRDGERATASRDADAVEEQLRGLVTTSRAALARTRQLLRGYGRPSLPTEIDSTRALLRAAGLEVRIEAPAAPLTAPADDSARAALRAATGALLRREPRGAVLITVDDDGTVEWGVTVTGDAGGGLIPGRRP